MSMCLEDIDVHLHEIEDKIDKLAGQHDILMRRLIEMDNDIVTVRSKMFK